MIDQRIGILRLIGQQTGFPGGSGQWQLLAQAARPLQLQRQRRNAQAHHPGAAIAHRDFAIATAFQAETAAGLRHTINAQG